MAESKYVLKIQAAVEGREQVRALADEVRELGDGASVEAGRQAQYLVDQLNRLGQQQTTLQTFQALSEAMAALAREEATLQTRAAEIRPTLDSVGNTVRGLGRAYNATQTEIAGLQRQQEAERTGLAGLRAEIRQNAEAQAGLRDRSRELKVAIQATGDPTGELARDLASVSRETDRLRERQVAARAEFKSLAEQTRQTGAAQRELKTYAKDVGDALKSAEGQAKALAGEYTRSQTEAQRLGQEQKVLAERLAPARQEMDRLGLSTENLEQQSRRLSTDLKGVSLAADDFKTHLKQAGAQGEAAGRQTSEGMRAAATGVKEASAAAAQGEGSFSRLTSRLTALAGTYLGINALRAALSSLFGTGAEFETLGRKITGLMGSMEAGQQAVAWIQQFASTTPLSVQGVTDAFIRLKAVGIDPMSGVLRAVTDQVVKLGGGQVELGRVLDQLTQAWTKQKLEYEDAKVLMEAGIPVYDLLSKTLGKSTQEVAAMASAGQLGRKELAALINEMERGAAGSAADAMGTWEGIVSNLGDSFSRAKDAFVKAGLFEAVKDGIRSAQQWLEEAVSSGLVAQWGKQVGETVTRIGETIAQAGSLIQGIVGTVQLAFNGFATGFTLIAGSVASFVAKVMEGWAWFQQKLGDREAADRARAIADSLTADADRYFQAFDRHAADTRAAWDKVGGALEAGKTQLVDALRGSGDAAQQAQAKGTSAAQATGAAWDGAAKQVKSAADGVTVSVEGMQGRATTAAEAVAQAFSKLGLKSQQTLRTEAEEAKVQFEVIRDSGLASAADLAAAFDVYAQKASAANNGVLPSFVGIQQAVYDTQAAMEAAGGSTGHAWGPATLAMLDAQQAAMAQSEAAKQDAEANAELADDMAGVASVAAAMAAHMAALRNDMQGLSEGALAAFDAAISSAGARLGSLSDATRNFHTASISAADGGQRFAEQIAETKREIGVLVAELARGRTEIGNWFIQTQLAADRVRLAFLEQSQTAQAYIERLAEMRDITPSVIAAAQGVAEGYNLLDQQTLSSLRGALADAIAKTEQLRDSARSALEAALQAAQEAGLANTELERENLEYARLRHDLEDQLAEARRRNDAQAIADLERAMALQEQAHQRRLEQLAEEQAAAAGTTAPPGRSPVTPGSQPPAGSYPGYRPPSAGPAPVTGPITPADDDRLPKAMGAAVQDALKPLVEKMREPASRTLTLVLRTERGGEERVPTTDAGAEALLRVLAEYRGVTP